MESIVSAIRNNRGPSALRVGNDAIARSPINRKVEGASEKTKIPTTDLQAIERISQATGVSSKDRDLHTQIAVVQFIIFSL